MGCVKLSSNGRHMVIVRTSLPVISACCNSPPDLSFWFPVTFRSLRARRTRMFNEEVYCKP